MPGTFVENYQRVLKDKGRMSGTQWSFHCPFEGCVGYSKRKFFVDPCRGYWCCKHCNKEVPDKTYRDDCKEATGGTWQEFVKMMDDDYSLWPVDPCFDQDLQVQALSAKERRRLWTKMFDWCSLLPAHAQLVKARGIDPHQMRVVSAPADLVPWLQSEFGDEMVIRGGLAYENSRGELLPRTCIADGRILIPYLDAEKVYYFVGYQRCPEKRPDQSHEEYAIQKDNWKKIAGPAGYTPAIYGNNLQKDLPFVIVTEGQFKAEAAIQRGFPCLGIQGINNAHIATVKAIKAAGCERVLILFDSEEDQEEIDYAAEKLARECLKADLLPFRACLPLDPNIDGGKKTDIDSFLVHHPLEAFVAVLRDAVPYEFEDEEEDDSLEEAA
jgi:hypothetical protein